MAQGPDVLGHGWQGVQEWDEWGLEVLVEPTQSNFCWKRCALGGSGVVQNERGGLQCL